MRTFVLASILSLSLTTGALAQNNTLQESAGGKIDWQGQYIEAVGAGVAPAGKPAGQARLLAERAAKSDAYRNLLELVQGVQVDAETTVRNYVTESDVIRTRVRGAIQGARRMGPPRYMSDGTVEVTLRMPLYGAKAVSGALGADRLMRRRSEQVQKYLNSKAEGVTLTSILQTPRSPQLPLLAQATGLGFVPLRLAQQSYTGLVLDMCTFPIRPAMSPAVFGPQNQVYIGNFPINPDQVVAQGVLQYFNDYDRAIQASRVGPRPLIVEATGTGAKGVDVRVSEQDAQRIQLADQNGQFLKDLKVVVATF